MAGRLAALSLDDGESRLLTMEWASDGADALLDLAGSLFAVGSLVGDSRSAVLILSAWGEGKAEEWVVSMAVFASDIVL